MMIRILFSYGSCGYVIAFVDGIVEFFNVFILVVAVILLSVVRDSISLLGIDGYRGGKGRKVGAECGASLLDFCDTLISNI